MSEPAISTKEIGAVFIDCFRRYRKPPMVSIESIEPIASGGGVKITAHDSYGPLPDSEIIIRGERAGILETVKKTADLTDAVAKVRYEIKERFSGCSFLVPMLIDTSWPIVDITRNSAQRPIVASGRDYLDAYIALESKLNQAAHMGEAAELMCQMLAGISSVFLTERGLTAQGDEGAAMFEIAATQLRKAGIRVVGDEKELKRESLPVLAIRLNLIYEPEGFAAVSLGLELWQMVSLVRSQELKTAAITWLSPVIVDVAPRSTVNGAILDALLKQFELFVDSYRYANEGRNKNE